MTDTANRRFLAWGLGFWLIFMIAATIDGIVRAAVLVPWVGETQAHMASGIFMLAVIYGGTWGLLTGVGVPRQKAVLWLLGLLWGALTVAFELLIVIAVRGEPASVLWADYHPAKMLAGNLILPGLVLMMLAPVILAQLRR